jgi:3',5'-cyclic AMP phosphodiesterase CpdA
VEKVVSAPTGPLRVVHLSDLHLGADAGQASHILEPLVRTLAGLRASWGASPSLLAITGDLYDSPDVDVGEATTRLVGLLGRLREALGGLIPTVVVPGNHDRRTQGLILPFATPLFDALAAAALPGVVVGGRQLPFLAELVDDALHGLPFAVGLIDSTYTPVGFISAGGLLRVEDLLELSAGLDARGDAPERPLLLLTHHHLIPTPVTDTSRIDADTTNPVLRFLAGSVLPRLVSYADHEEWMMTALGAGSALSTLHAFGRPVLVLHGHKHYPTARVLRTSLAGHGDVVLLSAGSAGLALPLDDGDEDDVARLWPSFHVLEIDGSAVDVRTVAFYGTAPPATRDLLHIEADGGAWRVSPVDDRVTHRSATVRENFAEFALRPCSGRTDARWDLDAARVVRGPAGLRYREHLRAAPGARFRSVPDRGFAADTRAIDIPTDGTPFRYTLTGGAVRSVKEALRTYGATDPYEGVELLCRYESDLARLSVSGLPRGARPFGSVVDLTRGRAMPQPLVRRADGRVEVVVERCAPRMQLRIQWRPERDGE